MRLAAHWREAAVLAVLGLALALWLAAPATALASHERNKGGEYCRVYTNTSDWCDCMFHVDDLVDEQLRNASPNPDDPKTHRSQLRGSFANNAKDFLLLGLTDSSRASSVAWWRVENKKEACARMEMMAAAKGITRLLAGSLTGLVGISFVWCVVQLMQESVSGGRVVEARNNLFRTMVGLIIFGFTWVIYESLTVGLFGVKQFTAGSFIGLTGWIGS